MAGFNYANSSTDDELQFFEGGAEFYSWGHLGWSPSIEQRQESNLQLLLHPALNPNEDTIWVTGLRLRMTF